MNEVGTPVLRAHGLRKEYGTGEGLVRAVDGVDLGVGAGETVAIMGPSGCGKSTLLHLLGGLDRPSGGEVRLNDRRIDNLSEKALARIRRTGVGYVFQSFHLMEELTAVENVELSALLAGRSPRAARQVLPALLGAVLGVFPGGYLLFAVIMAITDGDRSQATLPAAWQLTGLALATMPAVAALTAVPAHLGGRRPVTETL